MIERALDPPHKMTRDPMTQGAGGPSADVDPTDHRAASDGPDRRAPSFIPRPGPLLPPAHPPLPVSSPLLSCPPHHTRARERRTRRESSCLHFHGRRLFVCSSQHHDRTVALASSALLSRTLISFSWSREAGRGSKPAKEIDDGGEEGAGLQEPDASDDEHDGVRASGRARGGDGGRGGGPAARQRQQRQQQQQPWRRRWAAAGLAVRVRRRRRQGKRRGAGGLARGVPRPRGAGARWVPPELRRLLRRRDRRVPPRLRALPAPPRPRPRHLHVQGRGGVLQPGVQGAAHDAGGVEGQVRGDVDQGRCRRRGQEGQRPPRQLRQGRGHCGRGVTRPARTFVPTCPRRLHLLLATYHYQQLPAASSMAHHRPTDHSSTTATIYTRHHPSLGPC